MVVGEEVGSIQASQGSLFITPVATPKYVSGQFALYLATLYPTILPFCRPVKCYRYGYSATLRAQLKFPRQKKGLTFKSITCGCKNNVYCFLLCNLGSVGSEVSSRMKTDR